MLLCVRKISVSFVLWAGFYFLASTLRRKSMSAPEKEGTRRRRRGRWRSRSSPSRARTRRRARRAQQPLRRSEVGRSRRGSWRPDSGARARCEARARAAAPARTTARTRRRPTSAAQREQVNRCSCGRSEINYFNSPTMTY